MKGPIYKPKGAAAEYGKYALNIYTGCPHRCFYCYVPRVLHCDREKFHSVVEPRRDILELTKTQLEHGAVRPGETIFLCFTCDPYPTGYDSTLTREIIRLLKGYQLHVMILTKGDGSRDFDLLDRDDWYGITIDGIEESKKIFNRFIQLRTAKSLGINTWVSFEPVVGPMTVIAYLKTAAELVDKVKIGKLNYVKPDIDINWKAFGEYAEEICKKTGVDYYIKDSLRKEMERKS